jgi:2-C-methyl-D-erythritol 4-phosphate cytidylyltransferase / 2-C-methyl-D-erythritol 2,4-cyclodiphosphate synthase
VDIQSLMTNTANMDFSAIIVAGGTGSRAGQGSAKQWRQIGGQTVLRWSVSALLQAGASPLIIVIPEGTEREAQSALEGLIGWQSVTGGARRTDSVRAGLSALMASGQNIGSVLIHDAARPFVRADHIEALLEKLSEADGAVPALAMADSLKRQAEDGSLSSAVRDGLYRVQTPQAFRFDALIKAYDALPLEAEMTDDAGVLEASGGKVLAVPGDPMLFKLTYPEDFIMAEALAARRRAVRTGLGIDAHRFGPDVELWLCGVKIDHEMGLIGHSDADAGLHALTDALLGAIGEGDIGDHFPPTDPQWRGGASEVFLKHAADLVRAKGGDIINVDVTLICERPKIKPHRLAMRERVAAILGLPLERVSIKATTTEKMGFTGREEGLAAQAIASVDMPL